jgi:hypothetical protein
MADILIVFAICRREKQSFSSRGRCYTDKLR